MKKNISPEEYLRQLQQHVEHFDKFKWLFYLITILAVILSLSIAYQLLVQKANIYTALIALFLVMHLWNQEIRLGIYRTTLRVFSESNKTSS